MVLAAPAAVQPLRRSVLVGGLASLTVLAPIVGFAVSWSRAGQGSTVFAPLRTTDQPGGLGRLLAPGNTTPFTVGDPLALPGSDDAVYTYSSGGFRGGVAFIDHAPDPVFVALAAGGPALAGFTVALLVVLLLGVLRSIAAREPFAAGNAGLLAAAAVVLVGASVLGTVLPYLAALRFLALPFVDGAGWAADVDPVLWPLPAAFLLLVLAAAVRRGSRLTAETEGLV